MYCPGENDKTVLNFQFSTKETFKMEPSWQVHAGLIWYRSRETTTTFVIDFLPQCCLYWMLVFVPDLGFTNLD